MTDYKAMLEHSFAVEQDISECPPQSRLAYLAQHIFDFVTYDGEMDERFAMKAVEVCAAITNGTTFDYIAAKDDYEWFLLMCNMPFFAERIEWGTSIRGAWWGAPRLGEQIKLESCGLWAGDEQVTTLRFSDDDWRRFVLAVIEFASDAPETP